MTKKLISLLLCLTMVATLLSSTALAVGGETNVSLTISKETVSAGDEVEVVLSYGDMTVSSFACGFSFDTDKYECVSIVGADPEYPDEFGINKTTGKNTWVGATASPTVEESNVTGTVGFVVAGTRDVSYAAGVILTAKFVAKVDGEVAFTLYEDSDGKDGCKVSVNVIPAAGEPNVTLSVSTKSVSVGDEVVVSVYYKDMTVSSFACGFCFDTSKFECKSISGTDPEYPEDFGLNKASGRNTWVAATATPTVGESNVTGTVGFVVAGTKDVAYAADIVLTATFVAKSEGNADFVLFEDSDGANGFKSDSIITKSVEIHKFSDWTKYDGTQHIRTCSCGDIEYADHTWNAGEITTPATHLEFGVKTYTCTECPATKTEDVAKLEEHTFGAWTKHNSEQHKSECACGEAKYADHTWNEGEITTPATHLEFGVKTYTCTECSATRTEQIEKIKEHTFGAWTMHNGEQHKSECACGETKYADHTWNAGEITTPATHLAYGVKTYTCTECSGTRTEEVPKLLIDIDLDGDVDETDADLLLQYVTGHDVEVNKSVIDANGDGKVDIRDVATILLYIKS